MAYDVSGNCSCLIGYTKEINRSIDVNFVFYVLVKTLLHRIILRDPDNPILGVHF